MMLLLECASGDILNAIVFTKPKIIQVIYYNYAPNELCCFLILKMSVCGAFGEIFFHFSV